MHINRSLRLPATEYFAEPTEKTGIAIHHTVGGTVESTIRWWCTDRTPVGTAYLIERDGTVFEAFEPEAWAFQFGLRWADPLRTSFEKRFIGIELASEGGLTEHDGILYAFDRISPRTIVERDGAFDYRQPYRGYRWFARYEPAQLDALGRLVDELCTRFGIPRQYPERPFDYYGPALAEFRGVIGHAMVRFDKSDPAPDPALWATLEDLAALTPTAVTPGTPARRAIRLSRREQEALFHENARHINAMSIGAGSLVKTLVMELERRNVFVRLHDPAPEAHTIGYSVVKGDLQTIGRIARALGFRTATDGLLEVRHA